MRKSLLCSVLAFPIILSGCSFLEDLDLQNIETTIEDAREVEDRVPTGVTEVEVGMTGLSPSANYQSSGQIDLGLVARNGSTSSPSENVQVEVQNHDGSYSPCDGETTETHAAASSNVLSLMIDGSGSMERTYDPTDCATCPHDPGRERVGAAHRFIDTLYDQSRDNLLAIGEFGPDPSYGFDATVLRADFNDDRQQLWTALDSIGGYEPYGTPLWDSVTEMLLETEYVADQSAAPTGRFMVVLSDGQDNMSEIHGLWDSIDAANRAGIAVYAVGLGPASVSPGYGDDQTNTVLDLQTLATETGGFYASVDDPSRLHELFDNVAIALSGGFERTTVRCVPRATVDGDPIPPQSGDRVEGRVVYPDRNEKWAFIAP